MSEEQLMRIDFTQEDVVKLNEILAVIEETKLVQRLESTAFILRAGLWQFSWSPPLVLGGSGTLTISAVGR